MDNVPPFQNLSDDQLSRIRQSLGVEEIQNMEIPPESEQPQEVPKRRRGRPRKYRRDEFNRPIKDQILTDEERESVPILPSPTLTGRDTKELARRFKGLLQGASSIGAVLDPAIRMSDQEAESISTPLVSYLIRTESTSVLARRVLDEYDVAAFVIASLAYIVRVARDMQNERRVAKQVAEAVAPTSRVPTSGRAIEPTNVEPTAEQSISAINSPDENGQEGPVNREWASTTSDIRRITEV